MIPIGLVDYGMGNRRSAFKALEHVGATVAQTADHAVLRDCAGLVLPGVGAFPEAMRRLRALGLDELLRERAQAGVPLLGICLGMQLLFDSSTEHEGAEGLGLLRGPVTRLDAPRLPHIGWNLARVERADPLVAGLGQAAAFYHVHSFVPRCADPADVIATAEYGERFPTIVGRGNVAGTQFHPEKSSTAGLALLGNFCRVGVAA